MKRMMETLLNRGTRRRALVLVLEKIGQTHSLCMRQRAWAVCSPVPSLLHLALAACKGHRPATEAFPQAHEALGFVKHVEQSCAGREGLGTAGCHHLLTCYFHEQSRPSL